MISTIIPAHNAAKYLAPCVASVSAALPYGMDSEIIVVNDGSTDHTAELASSLGCMVLEQEQRGAAAARNRGLRQARGEYLLFVDADDILCDGAVAGLLLPFAQTPSLLAAFGNAVDFVSPELPAEERQRLIPRREPYGGCLPGCGLFRPSIFALVGPFDESMETGETVAWQLRMRDMGVPHARLPLVTLRRRLHPDSTSMRRGEQEKKDYLALLRKRHANKP